MTASERHLAPLCDADGPVDSLALVEVDTSLWLVASTLPDGTTLEWDPSHGDEALYVSAGALVLDGRTCGPGGALVVEAGAPARARAQGSTRVIHMGSRDPAPPADGPHGPAAAHGQAVHVVGPRGTFERIEEGRESRFFADATCPTCRSWLLYTARDFAYETSIHSHSQDELIYLLSGEVSLGSLHLEPGATLFVPKHQLYQLRGGADGFGFLNYRRDASLMRVQGEDTTLMENGRSTGMTATGDAR